MEEFHLEKQSFNTFILIWIGQFLSVLGSGLTQFALGIWVLMETGSVTQFSFIILAFMLPMVIISPFAGVIVDRYSRKKIMLITDSVAGLTTIIILLLVVTDSLQVWHIYITTGIASIFSCFQLPSYQSIVSLIVPKEQLGRANGMIQLADSSTTIIAPVVAGLLLHIGGLLSVLVIDLITFLVAVVTLAFARIPELVRKAEGKLSSNKFIVEIKEGWNYISERKGLKMLLIYFALVNFVLGFFNVAFKPLILSLSSEQTLGMVISITGIGMLLGGLFMSIWGGPKKRVEGLLGFSLISAIFIALSGFTTSIPIITACIFVCLLVLPVSNACSQAIWQSKIDKHIQGRVFALRSAIGKSLFPVGTLMSGPLIDYVFNPLMDHGGFLSSSVGEVIGVGEGRGAGLLFIIVGVCWIGFTITMYLNSKVRNIESEVPDCQTEVSGRSKELVKA